MFTPNNPNAGPPMQPGAPPLRPPMAPPGGGAPPMARPMMPPGANAAPPPPAPGGAPPPGAAQVPPQFARFIDPNNPMQMTLLQRIDKLTQQDGQALATGISPAAVAVLKKILPEVGFLLDMIGQPGGMSGPTAPGGAAPPPMAPGSAPMPQGQLPGGLNRPATKLTEY